MKIMKITNFYSTDYTEPKFLPELKPLFEAMVAGKIIKKVICMNGTSKKDNPNHDIIFENFIAEKYDVGESFKNMDEVHINKYGITKDATQSKNNYFFMIWVRSFELYDDFIELEDGRVKIVENFLSV